MTNHSIVQAYPEDLIHGEEEARRQVLAPKPGVLADSRRLPADLSILDAHDLRKPCRSTRPVK